VDALIRVAAALVLALFPLHRGASWTYEGDVAWTEARTHRVRTAPIRWKTAVVKTSVSGKRTVAIVRGFPFELAWHEPGRKPGYSVVVEDPRGIFVESADEIAEAEALAKRALSGEAIGDVLLRFPVRLGDCPGGPRGCWRVERALRPGWELVHRTNPDHQIVHFVPGVGITHYAFEHHGTVASANVRLVAR
jgi:hypothetical protein